MNDDLEEGISFGEPPLDVDVDPIDFDEAKESLEALKEELDKIPEENEELKKTLVPMAE